MTIRTATVAAVLLGVLPTQPASRSESARAGSANDADKAGVLHVYLARHGQTDWNAEGRLQGSADIPLNATGRKQAALLAARLAGVPIDAVYTSALKRSRQTGDLVRGSAPLVVLTGLNERRLGAFEGRVSDAIFTRRSGDPNDTLDGGESVSEFRARIQTALTEVLTRHRAGTILIVGHGGTNQMIVRTLFDLTAEQAAAFQPGNGELYLCDLVSRHPVRLWKLVTPGPL